MTFGYERTEIYEYIAVYVDDLSTLVRDNNSLIDALGNSYKFNLNLMGTILFYLGCDLFCDSNGFLLLA